MGRLSLLVGMVLCATQVAEVAAAEVGRLPDQFRVDPSGNASYSIPLTLPPGPGLVPNLGFNYNSANRAEGAMGVGWSFSEPPAIVRCGQNRRLDGKITGVQLTSEDRFCGPGGRLILASGVSTDYGKAKTVYHPELDPATRYEAKGSVTANASANGPACFIVSTKDGHELHYVAEELTASVCTDSLVASITTRIWRLTKEYSPLATSNTTTTGGDPREAAAIRYQYADVDPDAARFSPHLSKVFYGNNIVELSYQTKATGYWRFSYFAARKAYESMLLQSVAIKQGSTTVRSYGVSYEKSPDTERQRVIKISRSDERGGAMQVTGEVNLGWSNLQRVNAIKGMTFSGVFARYNNSNVEGGAQLSDKDGDGIAEILVSVTDASGVSRSDWFEFDGADRCQPPTPSCAQEWDSRYNATMPTFIQAGSTLSSKGVRQVDINADGYLDLIVLEGSKSQKEAWLNDGQGNFAKNDSWSAALPDAWVWWEGKGDAGARFVDVDGDGRVDILQGVYLNGTTRAYKAYLNNGSGFTSVNDWIPPVSFVVWNNNGVNKDAGVRLADINGDGLLDIIQLYRSQVNCCTTYDPRVWLNKGGKFVQDDLYTASIKKWTDIYYFSVAGANGGTELVDVNGDGLPDLITLVFRTDSYGRPLSNWPFKALAINTGFEFNTVNFYNYASGPGFNDFYVGGLQNAAISEDGRFIDLGTRAVDVNGDGLTDFVQNFYAPDSGYYDGAPQRRVFLNVGEAFVYRADLSGMLTDTYFSGGAGISMGTQVVDVNNDGLPEFAQAFDAGGSNWYGGGVTRRWHQLFSGRADNLVKITDGLGAETVINYKASTSGLYKKGSSAIFPVVDMVPPGELVASVETTNGVGGRNTVGYRYGGARFSREYGALGSEWQEVASSLTGNVSHAEFSQTFPYTSMVSRSQNQYCTSVQLSPWATSGCTVLKQLVSTFNKQEVTTTPGGKLYQPYVESSVEKAWDMPSQ